MNFTAEVTVIAEGSNYQDLTNDDFKIKLTGLAINSAASREDITESYEDYATGGNESMI